MSSATMDSLVQTYPDFSPEQSETTAGVPPFTMTPPERMVALTRAVDHIARNGIAGGLVKR